MSNVDTARMRRYTALNTAEALEGLGIKLPADVARAIGRHRDLVARRSTIPAPAAHRTEAATLLAEDPAADVSAHLARLAALEVERQTMADAIQLAMRAIRMALDLHADTIVAKLRTASFDPAVATLTTAAKVGSTSVGDLVRAKRMDEAHAVASVTTATATVQATLKARDALYPGAQLVWSRFHLWANPDVLEGVAPGDIVAGIAAGGRPWLATYTELDQAQQTADTERKRRKAATWQHPNRPAKATPAPVA